jgi:hypothetical protein
MSNYDYRPELEEQEEGEKQLKEKIKKLQEEEDDSFRDDREAPPC